MHEAGPHHCEDESVVLTIVDAIGNRAPRHLNPKGRQMQRWIGRLLLITACLNAALGPKPATASERQIGAAAAPQVSRLLELVVVTDHEMFLRYGADTSAVVRARVATADKIFRRELGVGLHLARIVVFETPDDPFDTPEGNQAIYGLADELASNRSRFVPSPSRADLLHLLTAREVGNPRGVSGGGGPCSGGGSASRFDTDDVVLEHELAHGIGALHDTGTCHGPYIMSGGGNGTSFSPCSKAEIAAALAQKTCQFEENLPTCRWYPADGDGDGLCDVLDRCASGTELLGVKLKLSAYRSMLLSGTANAGTTTVNPVADGLRVVVQTSAGGEVFDVEVPGGAYDAVTRRGWKTYGNGTRWTFVSKQTAVGGIVSKVILKAISDAPGWFAFTIQGTGSGVHPSVAGLAPRATLMLGADAAMCAETSFPSFACRTSGSGKILSCRN